MRALLILLTLALPAVAGGLTIRWLDATGGVRSDAVLRTISETGDTIRVEIGKTAENPKELVVPLPSLLEFIREDDRVPEQKRLFDARTAVRAGVDFDSVRPLLDRLVAGATQPWMREYADAARTILARRAGEKDSDKRIAAFLKRYPRSRFVAEVLIELAWLKSAKVIGATGKIEPFGDAFKEINRRGGPFIVAYGSIPLAARINARVGGRPTLPVRRAILGGILEERPEPSAPEAAVRYGGESWFDLGVLAVGWRRARAAGVKFGSFVNPMHELSESDGLALPEVRTDVRLELATLCIALGDTKRARSYLEATRKFPADAARRLLVERALRQLDSTDEKR